MKIALCQFNPIIGAMSLNAERLVDFAVDARAQGADLIVAPELAICGYPPKDLLFHPEFWQQTQQALDFIAQKTPIPFILGAPIGRENRIGQPFWNSGVLCEKSVWRVVSRKQLLPNYDVFDERRYFEPPTEPNQCIQLGEQRIGIVICEEVWNDPFFFEHHRYQADPVKERADDGATLLLNINASPFSIGKPEIREQLLQHEAKRHKIPVLSCCQVGAIDQIIFDGGSLVIDGNGETLGRLEPFKEGLLFATIDESGELRHCARNDDAQLDRFEWMRQALVCGISDYFRKCKATGAIVGLSGGIDSAVMAVLAVQALGAENVLGVRMPSAFSSDHSLEDAEELAKNLGIQLKTIPIEEQVALFRNALGHVSDITDQNLQSRVRGLILMALSNETGKLVLATGNKSELSVGYCTLYGDMCGALAPLGDIYKTDIWPLARHLNKNGELIPKRSIEKIPSAELKLGQSDQDSLPPYDQLDAILCAYMEDPISVDKIRKKTGLSQVLINNVIQMVHRAEYKRAQSPQILMLSDRVFGQGRRFPIAHQFIPG